MAQQSRNNHTVKNTNKITNFHDYSKEVDKIIATKKPIVEQFMDLMGLMDVTFIDSELVGTKSVTTSLTMAKTPQLDWEQFLIDMGWDEPKYGWTLEKKFVKRFVDHSVTIAIEEFAKKVDSQILGGDEHMAGKKPYPEQWVAMINERNQLKKEQRQSLKLLVKQSK